MLLLTSFLNVSLLEKTIGCWNLLLFGLEESPFSEEGVFFLATFRCSLYRDFWLDDLFIETVQLINTRIFSICWFLEIVFNLLLISWFWDNVSIWCFIWGGAALSLVSVSFLWVGSWGLCETFFFLWWGSSGEVDVAIVHLGLGVLSVFQIKFH